MQLEIKTSKMRFTNNRLTGLQTDKTWLGSSRVSRMQQNYRVQLTVQTFNTIINRNFPQKSATQKV